MSEDEPRKDEAGGHPRIAPRILRTAVRDSIIALVLTTGSAIYEWKTNDRTYGDLVASLLVTVLLIPGLTFLMSLVVRLAPPIDEKR
jgi:hypothetical protein